MTNHTRNAKKLANYAKGEDSQGEFPWRNAAQVNGVRAQLQRAINTCEDGATVTIELRTAESLVEICRQAAKTEAGIFAGLDRE